jgi:hypothetical protein
VLDQAVELLELVPLEEPVAEQQLPVRRDHLRFVKLDRPTGYFARQGAIEAIKDIVASG